MLEIINRLDRKRTEDLDNFFTYFGMYEDKKRTTALKNLLWENRSDIRGKIGIEAGAGLGDITKFILALGPEKILCVEENALCCERLKEKFHGNRRVEVINARIEDLKPRQKIGFLFQELYGPLLLEESLLCLERLKFKPGVMIPNEGALMTETVKLAELKDPLINKKMLGSFDGALITDLFMDYKFKKPAPILQWKFGEPARRSVKVKLNGPGELLVFGMEIRHNDKRVCGTSDCENWPYVFTPVKSKTFEMSFLYRDCYSDVFFKWL